MKTPGRRAVQRHLECGDYIGKAIPPSCPAGSSLIVRMQAPSCWDGRSLDSADHKSHVVWPVNGVCPAGNPVPLPMFEMKVPYKLPGGNTSGLAYSSGNGSSFHYDFMNGWDAPRQAALVATASTAAGSATASAWTSTSRDQTTRPQE